MKELIGEHITLEPMEFEEIIDYLLELDKRDKYRADVTDSFLTDILRLYGVHFWKVYHKQTKVLGGVIYIQKIKCEYTIDGFDDRRVVENLDNKTSYSKEAINLVYDFVVDKYDKHPYILCAKANRPLRLLLTRMKMKIEKNVSSEFGNYLVYKKR